MKPGRTDESPTAARAGEAEAPADRTSETMQVGRGRRRGSVGPQGTAVASQVRDPRRYDILGEHGRGALGRVSRAHDRELGRDVAIKELHSLGRIQEVRFLREARITARLEHPGIVPVYEAGRWPDGKPYYTMKSVSGRPLRDLISERPADERIGLLHHVIAVADAIAYAHGCNIIHRDLKPANVIVGEFGETIVIDWGLAKDLGSDDDDAGASDDLGADLGGSPDDDQLTVTGTVLGTPAYMAPEQRRGERVDQRADVFGIGIMLWELCAAQRKPPTEPHARRRMLRQAGIDRDLITIIEKALDPDPERRYHDAGALAADLKAFKSGTRIAARHYSLFALLAHWARRHRTLAIAFVALIVVAVIASVVYVRNIAAERDRADASQELARRAQTAAEAARDELVLKHAQGLLITDPTAALDQLATYHGADRGAAERIRAEAVGRGVALIRALPHSNNVMWTGGAADGAVLSIGFDGAIALTSRDGGSAVIARGVSRSAVFADAPARHLVAYACDPSDVCLFDTLRAARASVDPALRNAKAVSVAFSPDGMLLAVLSQDAVVTILDVADPTRPAVRVTRPDQAGSDIAFVDDRSVAIGTPTGISVVPFAGAPAGFAVSNRTAWAARPGALAVGTASGQAFVLDVVPLRDVARAELCRGPIGGLRFLPGRVGIAYACRSGTVGIWDPERGTTTPRAQLENRADLLTTDAAGNYLVAAGGNGTVTVIDLQSDVVASYKGHGFRLTSITAPTPEHPVVISGDVRGGMRAWPLPTRLVRIAVTSSSWFNMAIFDGATGTVAATTWRPELTILEPSGASRTVGPHEPKDILLVPAGNGRTFAAFGLNDLVEIWSSETMTRTLLVATGHGSVSSVRFVGDRDDFITAGPDGRVLRWTPTGQATLIAQANQAIDRFALLGTGAIVFSTVDGALWRTDAAGGVISVRSAGARINRIIAVPDPLRVYVGYASGEAVVVDAASWQSETVLRGTGAIQEIAGTNDGRIVAIATNEGTLHVGMRDAAGPAPARMTWTTWEARARHIVLSPEGLLLATYTDGTIWLYAPVERRWLCMPSGTVDLARAALSPSGDAAVVADIEGRLIWVDVAAARKQLARIEPLELSSPKPKEP